MEGLLGNYPIADNVSSFTRTYSSNIVTLELVLTQAGRGTVRFRDQYLSQKKLSLVFEYEPKKN